MSDYITFDIDGMATPILHANDEEFTFDFLNHPSSIGQEAALDLLPTEAERV